MDQRHVLLAGGSSDPRDREGLCLLSLDGGGVRGLSTLYVLKHIMDRLNTKLRQEEAAAVTVRPCDIFDVIGGTSTGGLIASMLGRLGMDVDECIEAYKDMMKGIFEQSRSAGLLARIPMYPTGKIKPSFSSRKLRDAIITLCKDRKMDATEPLDDGVKRRCKTLVCSVAKEDLSVVRLRCYKTEGVDNTTPSIVEAALATSAATSYFEAATIGNRKFVDGGLAVNNPAEEVEWEAQDIWCTESGDIKKLVSCFVTIGTGVPSTKSIQDSLRLFATDTMPSLISDTEKTEKRIIARWRQELDEGRFFRFNVDQGLQRVRLADYQQEGLIDVATTTYLNHQVQLLRVRDCVKILVAKQTPSSSELHKLVKDFEATQIYTEQSRFYAEIPREQGYATRKEIMDSLYFPEHDARIKMLDPPWSQTFDWIFQPKKDLDTRSDFSNWLRSGSEIFWISGKLGSGKSTLMAHILHNKRTELELRAWGQSMNVQIVSFFFWRAGSQRQELQNTISGLLRSLIFQLLDQIEGLAEVVAERCRLKTGRVLHWEENSLRTLLHAAISAAQTQRLCFFIDGLDEFRGDDNKLASEVCSIFQKHPNAKLCVSSRPEEPLVQRFAVYPQLKMEKLNHLDIKQYVVDQLNECHERYKHLTSSICHRAEGVFLWAVVVTREIVLAIQNGEESDFLEQRIKRLHPEMDKLFEELIRDIDSHHKSMLGFFINVMALVTYTQMEIYPSVALLAAALSKDGIVSYTDFAQHCQSTERQINAYSKGLLKVDFEGFGANDFQNIEYMWSIPQEAFRDIAALKGLTSSVAFAAIKARRAAYFPRQSTHAIVERQVIRYLLSKVEWSHRSAYDFIAKEDVQVMLELDRFSAWPKVRAKLMNGHLQLLATAPSEAAHDTSTAKESRALPSSFGRIVSMVNTINMEHNAELVEMYRRGRIISMVGTIAMDRNELVDMYGSLDRLRDLVMHMKQDDLDGNSGHVAIVNHSSDESEHNTSTQYGLKAYPNETTPDIIFWRYCIRVELIPYLHDRLQIFECIEDRGLMVASVIEGYDRITYWKPSGLPTSVWTETKELHDAGSALLQDLLSILVRQRARLSRPTNNRRLNALLLDREEHNIRYCDITWISGVRDEQNYNIDRTVVQQICLARLWWAEGLDAALSRKTLSGIQLERAIKISKMFVTLLDEWSVYIGTRFSERKEWGKDKLSLQVSMAGMPQTKLRSLLPVETKQDWNPDEQPSFRLFYNAPDLALTRFDDVPVHDISTTLSGWLFAPSDSYYVNAPTGRFGDWRIADLRSLVENDEAFRRALVEDIHQRRPATRCANEMIQALENRDHKYASKRVPGL
ncbi:hypothetical protein LTR97_012536 [Elasticomyces elasticus]|uniref:PNPLA domain-containing protein n=1 Tax=Elasticomyces elasticus TaxID=574655 RepID=A0AAN7ZYV6_9PEZI|nr:hypothetical protein LTR97_012536 [Elasticomyces elasticus]